MERINKIKSDLGYALQAPKRWTGLMRRNTIGRAIRGSNSIEGYHVTVEDAIAAAQGEEPLDASPSTWAAITGYRTAMTYVVQLADDPHFAYSTALLRSLHFMMMHYDLKKHPGRWRPGPVFVYDEDQKTQVYEGPDATLVPGLMRELVGTLHEDQESPVVVRAAMAHLNLVMIHPFSDGNGRMARCLQTLVLARAGTLSPVFSSIEEHLGANQRPYYDVLAEVGQGSWHPRNDTRPWVRFCLRAHFIQAHTLLRRTREIARLWDAIESATAPLALPDRTMLALTDAALGYKIRNATYRSVAEISDDVASRDLKAMTDAGLLMPQGERRGRYYVAAPHLLDMRKKTVLSRDLPDPFDESDEELLLPGLEEATS